ncbi:MAG: hypothetical protein LBK75_06945 [Oscillospiraceae bacterium]|nr:hypothetical protein [Oscillospiraceae bacterium]
MSEAAAPLPHALLRRIKIALRGFKYIVAHPSELMLSGPTGRYKVWVFAVYNLILPAFSAESYYPNGWFFLFCLQNSGEKWVENPVVSFRGRGKTWRENAENPEKHPGKARKEPAPRRA